MATRYTDEFRRDAVRIAITSGLTRPQVSSDLGVGHRRVGRLMRENGIKIVRTHKYKATTIAWQAIAKQSAERGTATTRSTSRPTCWIRTSRRTAPTKNGPETSATSGLVKAGSIWLSSLIYTLAVSSVGPLSWMSGKGNFYDNSMVETFFKSIKAELIWRTRWGTRSQAERAIFQYINGFYNPRRRHSSLGGKSPVSHMQAYAVRQCLAFERKAA
jgi:putative transposase